MNEHAVEELLAERFGRRHVLLTGNGTTALYIALRYARESRGCSSAVYPEMTCQTAINAALFADLPCRFIDIGRTGFLADPAGWQQRDDVLHGQCLVMTDLFGYMHTEEQLQGVNAFGYVIEDAAQAFFSVSSDGRHAGTLGDASVFSFGPGKHLDVGGGGVLLTNDGALMEFGRQLLATVSAERAGSASLRKDHYRQLLELEKKQLSRAEHIVSWHGIYRRNRTLFLSGFDRDLTETLVYSLQNAEALQAELFDLQAGIVACLRQYPVGLVSPAGNSLAWRLTFTLDSAAERNRLLAWLEAAGMPVSTLFQPASCLNSDGAPGSRAVNTHSRLINLDLKKIDIKQFRKALSTYEWNG